MMNLAKGIHPDQETGPGYPSRPLHRRQVIIMCVIIYESGSVKIILDLSILPRP